MKVKSIVIEVEREEGDPEGHATVFQFRNGMWETNGPAFSRFQNALHETWKLWREIVGATNAERKPK